MSLKDAIREGREQARRHPERYLSGYPDIVVDDKTALVSESDFRRMEGAGYYDSTLPTGVYIGKIWLKHHYRLAERDGRRVHELVGTFLIWYGIDKTHPDTHCVTNVREIVIV